MLAVFAHWTGRVVGRGGLEPPTSAVDRAERCAKRALQSRTRQTPYAELCSAKSKQGCDLPSSTLVSMKLDHVLIAVADLAAAGREIESRHGLASIEGGRHPAWGTANRVVPLGDSYLELVAVVDAAKAVQSAFGRWVASGVSSIARPLGWAVRTSQLDALARRLDLPVHAGSRTTPGGDQLRWRSAGIDQAVAEPSLPFFIEWGRQTQLPGHAAISHRAGNATISRLVLDADPVRLIDWLGDHQLPIVVRAGKPAVTAIYISSDAGEIVLGLGG